jgi:asparagine synthase (glutamine-hydrolysing)
MCGIAGIFSYRESAPPVNQEELLRVREAMMKRGPDGAGLWLSDDNRVGLAHRRLTIIDLSNAGAQPMATDDGQLRITFNGEIYNYRAIRKELELKGIRFHSESDTEVLLHLYADRGMDMVHALRGMYAFGIWDERRKALFLARDPFGIKPLYYSNDGATLRFASQVKALAAGGGVNLTSDPAGHAGFYLWGHVPEPFTMYREVQALPAGTTLWLDRSGRHEVKRFASIPDIYASAEAAPSRIDAREIKEELRRQLLDSVEHHLVADVPVGVFLSSGKDSATLASLASELKGNLRTITLGFREFQGTNFDEVPIAEFVARQIGANHETIWVGRKDFETDAVRFMASMDQPTIDGVNSYFVAKAASQAGLKVALSGLGGDEIFGGYSTFAQLPQLVAAASPLRSFPNIGRGFRRLTAPLLKYFTSPKWAGFLEYGGSFEGAYLLRRSMFMPWELPEIMDPDVAKEGWTRLEPVLRLRETAEKSHSAYLKVSALELCWYMRNQLLRDADWASMAHSLEVRVPLLDLTLLRSLAPMLATPQRPSKLDMATSVAKRLPNAVLLRPKTGFNVPVRDWLLEANPVYRDRGLRGWARRVIADWPATTPTPQPATLPLAPHAIASESVRGVQRISAARPRRVGLLASEVCSFGGIQAYMKRIMEVMSGLEKSGEAECFCISLNDTMPVDQSFDTGDGNIKFIGSARSKLRYVWQCYANAQPTMTLLVGHLSLAPVAWLLRGIGRISSYVVIIYGIEAWSRRPWLERVCLVSADAIIAITKFTATTCAQANGADQSKFLIIPPCIVDRPVAPSTSLELKGKFRILAVGRQDKSERYKGYETLIDAVERLARNNKGVQLHLVGNGDDHARLQTVVEQRGLGPSITMWGSLADAELEAAYASCDIFALPSKKEGFGIVFLEAMRHSKPCIGGDHGGTPEVVNDGTTGFLVDYGDVTGLYKALQVLYDDTALRHKMGVAGRKRFEDNFTFDVFRARYVSAMVTS